jgi:3-oxoacyl-[acyl-carrier-protein] synthase-1
MKRVAITGYGIISSIGNNVADVLDSLKTNKSGVEFVSEWANLGFKSCIAGTIKGIDKDYIRKQIGLKSRFMDDCALYSIMATNEALAMSKLSLDDLRNEKFACIVGSGISNTDSISRAGTKLKYNENKITPFDVARSMSSSCSANLVYYFGMKGRSYSVSSACATSLHNIGNAFELIRAGGANLAIAGGTEEVSSIVTSMFDAMRTALSSNYNNKPEKASRPYDKDRDGFVISGGAGILILEDLDHAINRGADIIAEIIGFGASSDGHDIIQPHPNGDGAYRCMKEAISIAKIDVSEINYINTHGTSTMAGDLAEITAIDRLFDKHKLPISSTKSITGHGIGAAGAQEIIYSLIMQKHNFISASMNIDAMDERFLDMNIVKVNQNTKIDTFLSNSFGFGGTNSSILITNKI